MERIIFDVVKHETGIKGYWMDNAGKVYIDNIQPIKCHSWSESNKVILALFSRGELAVFYQIKGKAYIEGKDGNLQRLNVCLQWKEKELPEGYIKALLNQHGGFTVYQRKDGYLIETWKE